MARNGRNGSILVRSGAAVAVRTTASSVGAFGVAGCASIVCATASVRSGSSGSRHRELDGGRSWGRRGAARDAASSAVSVASTAPTVRRTTGAFVDRALRVAHLVVVCRPALAVGRVDDRLFLQLVSSRDAGGAPAIGLRVEILVRGLASMRETVDSARCVSYRIGELNTYVPSSWQSWPRKHPVKCGLVLSQESGTWLKMMLALAVATNAAQRTSGVFMLKGKRPY